MARKKATNPEQGIVIETPETTEEIKIKVVMKKTVIYQSTTYENGKQYEVDPATHKLLVVIKAVR